MGLIVGDSEWDFDKPFFHDPVISQKYIAKVDL